VSKHGNHCGSNRGATKERRRRRQRESRRVRKAVRLWLRRQMGEGDTPEDRRRGMLGVLRAAAG